MPHLAPLSWSVSLIFFFFFLVGVCSLIWWMKGVNVKIVEGNYSSENNNKKEEMGVWKW